MQSEHRRQHTLADTLTGLDRLGSVVLGGGVFTKQAPVDVVDHIVMVSHRQGEFYQL